MVSREYPRHQSVRQRTEDRGQLRRQTPKTEELGKPSRRGEHAHDRASGRLRGTHAQPRDVGGKPEGLDALRGARDQHHRNPANQSQRNCAHMANGILHVAERECAGRRRHVDHQDQDDGLLGGEFHRFLGVNCRQRDYRLYARLIKHDAKQEAPQVAIVLRVPERLQDPGPSFAKRAGGLRPRLRALAQKQECRQARYGEQPGRNEHRDRQDRKSVV